MTEAQTHRRFVISSLPRCGSTTLARLLNCHPDVQCLIEPFHPKRYHGTFHELALAQGDVESALERIWSRWNGIKHVWEANGWPFVAQPGWNERVMSGPGVRVVFLNRRNLLRRLVSNLICRQTQYWIGSREEFCARLEQVRLKPLNPDFVLKQMQDDRDAVARAMDSLASRNVPTLSLCYEDVFREDATAAERLSLVNRVLTFLQFPAVSEQAFEESWQHHFNPDSNRWASPEVYQRIPGIERVEQQAGCEATGWLFR